MFFVLFRVSFCWQSRNKLIPNAVWLSVWPSNCQTKRFRSDRAFWHYFRFDRSTDPPTASESIFYSLFSAKKLHNFSHICIMQLHGKNYGITKEFQFFFCDSRILTWFFFCKKCAFLSHIRSVGYSLFFFVVMNKEWPNFYFKNLYWHFTKQEKIQRHNYGVYVEILYAKSENFTGQVEWDASINYQKLKI